MYLYLQKHPHFCSSIISLKQTEKKKVCLLHGNRMTVVLVVMLDEVYSKVKEFPEKRIPRVATVTSISQQLFQM